MYYVRLLVKGWFCHVFCVKESYSVEKGKGKQKEDRKQKQKHEEQGTFVIII